MRRFIKIESGQCQFIKDDDLCYHIGEYTSYEKRSDTETNQQISNLKKSPNASPRELEYKRKAVKYWGDKLLQHLKWEDATQNCTFVTIPGSKAKEDPEYDPRMELVLDYIRDAHPDIDARAILYQKSSRETQRSGARKSPDEIYECLAIDELQLETEPKPNIVLLDDVITRGASFKAAKRILQERLGDVCIYGFFLAKTAKILNH